MGFKNDKPPAAFVPLLGTYNAVKPLRYWVQSILPLTFDDSLSYMELLNKVVAKLNEIIETVNESEATAGSTALHLWLGYPSINRRDTRVVLNPDALYLNASKSELFCPIDWNGECYETYEDALEALERICDELNKHSSIYIHDLSSDGELEIESITLVTEIYKEKQDVFGSLQLIISNGKGNYPLVLKNVPA